MEYRSWRAPCSRIPGLVAGYPACGRHGPIGDERDQSVPDRMWILGARGMSRAELAWFERWETEAGEDG